MEICGLNKPLIDDPLAFAFGLWPRNVPPKRAASAELVQFSWQSLASFVAIVYAYSSRASLPFVRES